MNKKIIFGAGKIGGGLIKFIGNTEIDFFVDNDPQKAGKEIEGIQIKYYSEVHEAIRDRMIIVAVGADKCGEIIAQLRLDGIERYIYVDDFKKEVIKERIESRPDYIGIYHNAIRWIKENTIAVEGIICNTMLPLSYPEVSGYYIPTLLRWGYRDLAVQYARWLCRIQKADGSWFNTEDTEPYIFDSAQILRGLIAIRQILPEVEAHIKQGVDWILSNMTEEGRLPSPRENDFGDGRTFHEVIHIYCLSSLVDAADIFDRPEYKEKAFKILKYYLENYGDKITTFDLLSHFYAYVMEGLLDLGKTEIVRSAMDRIALLQKKSGAVPGYHNVNWVCSPGLFQLALVWFRLGDLEHGNKAFSYACKLQNESGGWYGSYISEEYPKEVNTYMPNAEVSWANKYFLDALYWKNKAEFERQASSFKNMLPESDGRYCVIDRAISDLIKHSKKKTLKVLDAGCGKGAYLKNIRKNYPELKCYATDISEGVMDFISDSSIECRQGLLTSIPFDDEYFDVVYACEALEHAIDVESAIREMTRVIKSGGIIVIIDKNKEKLGEMEIEEWEQWFDDEELKTTMENYCSNVEIDKNIGYEKPTDGLFHAWKGIVR